MKNLILILILAAFFLTMNGQDVTECKYFWSAGDPPSVPVEITDLPSDTSGGSLIIKGYKPEGIADVIRILREMTEADASGESGN